MPGRQRDDQVAMERHRGWGPDRDQPAIRPARERRDAAFDLARVAHADRGQLHTERRRRRLDRGETTRPGGNPRAWLAAWRLGERREIGATSPLEGELKKRELVLTVTGQRTHLTPSTYSSSPALPRGFFYPASARSCGSRVAYAGGVWLFALQSPERVA